MQFKKVLMTGFAIFAVLFGAGNVVFPLIVGRDMGDHFLFGLGGFVVTAVIVPFIGLFAIMLNHGDYKLMLSPLGKIPTFLISLICMILIGPFAITPRCITISHAALKMHFPHLSLFLFSIVTAVIIFIATIKNSTVIDLLGKYLGPLKLTLLFTIVMKGLFTPSYPRDVIVAKGAAFSSGLFTGYGTCDLLASIFLSGLILSGLYKGMHPEQKSDTRSIIKWGVQANLIGGVLLALVYLGFCIVSHHYGTALASVENADLFSSLAVLVLGQHGGLLANVTVAISCVTTAIALTAVFAMYLHKDLFGGRMSYSVALLITVVLTACMSTIGFSGIMRALAPVIQVLYPILIVYTFINVVFKLWKLETHQPVDLTMEPESSDWEIEE